jgi:hypothetical protein
LLLVAHAACAAHLAPRTLRLFPNPGQPWFSHANTGPGVLQTIESTREADMTMVQPNDEEVAAEEDQDEFAGALSGSHHRSQVQGSVLLVGVSAAGRDVFPNPGEAQATITLDHAA